MLDGRFHNGERWWPRNYWQEIGYTLVFGLHIFKMHLITSYLKIHLIDIAECTGSNVQMEELASRKGKREMKHSCSVVLFAFHNVHVIMYLNMLECVFFVTYIFIFLVYLYLLLF